MSDKYESVRSLPFPALASALGIDMARFKRRQADWQGFCPIHQSKTNNGCFAYHDSGKFHCFSCGAKGSGAIDLFKLVKNVGFQAAVEALGAVPTVEPSKEKSPARGDSGAAAGTHAKSGSEHANNANVCQTAATSIEDLKPYTGQYHKFAVPCPWLEARIPDATIRERYGVFCYENKARKSAYSGRVMIPVKDVEGKLYGYLGRYTGNTDTAHQSSAADTDIPKYLFPRNLPKHLFLFGAAEILAGTFGPAPLRVVYLVESPFCVMKFAMYGLPALSPFGWSVSPEQLELLTHLAKGTVYLPDRNKSEQGAGIVAALATRLWVRFPPLPEGCDDPEQLTKEQVLALTH